MRRDFIELRGEMPEFYDSHIYSIEAIPVSFSNTRGDVELQTGFCWQHALTPRCTMIEDGITSVALGGHQQRVVVRSYYSSLRPLLDVINSQWILALFFIRRALHEAAPIVNVTHQGLIDLIHD